jgi:HAD superfamily hydrolase (TIGR01490 family)
MQRKAAFFDVDGTLTTGRVWRGIMDYFKQRSERRLINALFWARHMPIYFAFKLKLVGQSAFRRPWAANLPTYFRGYTVEEAQTIWDYVVDEYLPPLLRPDALALIQQHKQAGDLVVLVSAGPTPLQERIAAAVGADLAVGTEPEVVEGRYTGRSRGPVCMDEYKPLLTLDKLSALGIEVDLAASHAYADSAGDVGLLGMAGHPVALHPDAHLRPIAEARGWKIME